MAINNDLNTRLSLESIRIDGDTQSRAALDEEAVREYAEHMRAGISFPAIVVFYDGQNYWLADGFHRLEAAKHANCKEIDVEIKEGTNRDAILYSVGANTMHGVRRTNLDKRRAVQLLLQDEEWFRWADRLIARRCGVSNRFVTNIRNELSVNGSQIEKRFVTRGGTTYAQNTTHIGKDYADYIAKLAPEPIKDRVEAGELAPKVAYKITQQLAASTPLVNNIALTYGVSDPAIIPVLERLEKHKSQTLKEIAATGYVQGAGEPIPLIEANVRDLEDVISEARFSHIQEAIELKHQKQPALVNGSEAVVRWVNRNEICLRFDADTPITLSEDMVLKVILIASEKKGA